MKDRFCLDFDPSVATEMLELANASPDLEVCGILGGTDQVASLAVQRLVPVANLSSSHSGRFDLSLRDIAQAASGLVASGLRVVGLFHSHPGGRARASLTDMRLARTIDVALVVVVPGDRRATVCGYVGARWVERDVQLALPEEGG